MSGPSGTRRFGSFIDRLSQVMRYEIGERAPLRLRKSQSQFGSPPQYVVGGLRPFLLHQVAHLGSREISAEAFAQIVDPGHILEHVFHARPVSMREPPRVLIAEKRPALRRTPNKR